MLSDGAVHGRFQPLHKGHLEYILAAKKLCKHLWVGITQIDFRSLKKSPADKHREKRFNNPLSYFERFQLIKEVLSDEGLDPLEYTISPFPIDSPDLLHDFLPITVPIFTTIYEEWNRFKIKLLQQKGYEVKVLYERDTKLYNGVEIRQSILTGDDSWKLKVPDATVRLVERLNLKDRLSNLAGE
jgi:cytidyltransferase-like protein